MCPRQKFCRKEVVKKKFKNDEFILKSSSRPKMYVKLFVLNSGLKDKLRLFLGRAMYIFCEAVGGHKIIKMSAGFSV